MHFDQCSFDANCTKSVPKVHSTKCSFGAKCTESALPYETAPKVHQKCTMEVHFQANYTKSAPKVHQKCTSDGAVCGALLVHFAPKVHCSTLTFFFFRHIFSVEIAFLSVFRCEIVDLVLQCLALC